MKVLLVAPRQNLPDVDVEIENIWRSRLDVTPMFGRVYLPELMKEIRSGEYDVLWFATHGSVEGIQLTDKLLSAEELVPLVRDRFSLVVLNTCSSLPVAQLLQVEANVTVICTVLDVPDVQAFQTGSHLAAALYESGNYTTAYSASIPGRNRTYLFLAALSPNRESLDAVMTKLDHLQNVVDRQKSWERKALMLSLSLHPITWLVMWFLWSKA
jgi:hypothetical protein